MADKLTVDKVKELLETNAYAPLKDAAEKWLAQVDEKYGDKIDEIKEKAAPVVDEIKEKAAPVVDEIKEKSAPTVEELKKKAAPAMAELKEAADGLKDAADEALAKAQPTIDKISDSEFVAKLKESISTLNENIEFFGSKAGEDAVGKEAAEQIRKHAEEMKAQGKTYCDCPACTKAREILKELGIELEEESKPED